METSENLNDLELWRIAISSKSRKEGNEAFGLLFEKYFEKTTLYLYSLAGNLYSVDECADIVMDFFLGLEEKRRKGIALTHFHEDAFVFEYWLKGNLKRRLWDNIRIRRRRKTDIRLEFAISIGIEISIGNKSHEEIEEITSSFMSTLSDSQQKVLSGLLDGMKLFEIERENGWKKRTASDHRNEIKKKANKFLPQNGIPIKKAKGNV